jgi:hypothetical protein
MKWTDEYRSSGKGSRPIYHTITSAIVVPEVDASQNIYCRIGWAEVVGDDCFEEEKETNMILV